MFGVYASFMIFIFELHIDGRNFHRSGTGDPFEAHHYYIQWNDGTGRQTAHIDIFGVGRGTWEVFSQQTDLDVFYSRIASRITPPGFQPRPEDQPGGVRWQQLQNMKEREVGQAAGLMAEKYWTKYIASRTGLFRQDVNDMESNIRSSLRNSFMGVTDPDERAAIDDFIDRQTFNTADKTQLESRVKSLFMSAFGAKAIASYRSGKTAGEALEFLRKKTELASSYSMAWKMGALLVIAERERLGREEIRSVGGRT
jgi:hypothetical protein